MSLLRIDATDTELEALMDCLTLGIAEALADTVLDRELRISLDDVCAAFRIADQMQAEISAGRKDTCTEVVG